MRSSATDRKPESMFQQKTGSSWKTRRWAVILTLGVVIMFVSTSLSVVETLFFNRLPVANERSLAIIENNPSYLLPDGFPSRRYLPYAAFEYLGPDFMGMDIAAMSAGEATIMDRGFPERIGIELVSTNFFRVLGVEPALGRTFIDSDRSGQSESAEPVCVISETLWQRRYNRDPDILGRQIFLNGESVTIVGVLPPGFESWRNERTELWALLDRSPFGSRAQGLGESGFLCHHARCPRAFEPQPRRGLK